jgi:two-component sensor histidine kinase
MAGKITVRLAEATREGEPVVMATVDDDGVGLPPSTGEATGLGQTVIASLLRSMRATMAVTPQNPGAERPGCKVVVTFPKRS